MEIKNMENVIVFCECNFTRKGIKALLQSEYRITSAQTLTDCQSYVIQHKKVDLIILSFFTCGKDIMARLDALTRLCILLRRYQPSCKVLLNVGHASAPMQRFYLNHLETCFSPVDFKWSVSRLKTMISGVIAGHAVLPGLKLLNQRERSVLRALIMESTACEIASALKLSVKTVSGYKCMGLSKLGARSIQSLLSPAARK